MNPFLGIFYHALGGLAAASFYIPYNKVKNWAWEVYWLTGGFVSWVLMPLFVSLIFVPDLRELMRSVPLNNLVWPYIFGILWGIGGLTFGLTMRYLGISLGMALALGLTATFGTLVPPLWFGQFHDLITHLSGWVTLGGVAIALFGIFLTGKAGMMKDREMAEEEKKEHIKEFNLKKGIWVALFAGVMSASFAFGIAAGKPVAQLAIDHDTPVLFSNSPVFILIMAGGFTTNFLWCVMLAVRNHTLGDWVKVRETPILANYLFSALAGITWYMQFMFYGMGTTKMGKYDFVSWSIHMAFIIVFSTLWGLILKEWKGSGRRTMRVVGFGLAVLVISIFIIGAGNYIQQFE